MSRLNDIKQRSDEICDAVAEAHRLAGKDIWCNGYGIIADPSMVRLELAAAHAKLGEALKLLRETPWPHDDDYGALELEHNGGRS